MVFSLSILNSSKTTRRVFIFSISAFFSLVLACLSSIALELDWLAASIALALSVLILSSSERRETVVAFRPLICLELFSFKVLNSLDAYNPFLFCFGSWLDWSPPRLPWLCQI